MPAYSSLLKGGRPPVLRSPAEEDTPSSLAQKNYRTHFGANPVPAYNAPLLSVTFIEELFPGAKTTLFAFTFPDSTQTIF